MAQWSYCTEGVRKSENASVKHKQMSNNPKSKSPRQKSPRFRESDEDIPTFKLLNNSQIPTIVTPPRPLTPETAPPLPTSETQLPSKMLETPPPLQKTL